MSDIKRIVADNINKLRTEKHITQMELAEKLNYSDKAVSKWERAESIPDVTVLKQIGEIFGVSVDYLLTTHDGEETPPVYRAEKTEVNYVVVSLIAVIGIWTIALFLFFLLKWILAKSVWEIFVYALPVTFIAMLVFHSLWGKRKFLNFWIVSALMWSILAVIYVSLLWLNLWQLFILGITAEILIFLSFKVRKKGKK